MNETLTLRITRPDDWHVHLRDGAMLAAVLDYTARQFARAIVMPNLVPPTTTVEAARAYADRIGQALRPHRAFTPLMTCYLTDGVDPDELERGFQSGAWVAAKLYPAHATTNSAHGVSAIEQIFPALERMQKIGMPLLVHGEVTSADIDIFDREAVFIDQVLAPTIKRFPGLKIVFEHVTTEQAVDFVQATPQNLAATITPHHLMINRNAMFQGGLRPHHYCLPVPKRERHRLALRRAATSGDARFFLGTDTAPHLAHAKEAACGCAGIFSAPTAIELYAEVFDQEGALSKLEAFASLNGPAFYGLPVNQGVLTLQRQPQTVPERITVEGGDLVPFRAGGAVSWSLVD